MMRRPFLALAFLALAPPALGQVASPPAELPGFARKDTRDGARWWYRHVDGWDYFARPTSEVINHPPLSIVANNKVLARNYGIDFRSWASAPVPGFTIGGPARQPEAVETEGEAATKAGADAAWADAEPEESGDPIELWCRRRHIDPNAAYGAFGGLGGLLLALLGFLIRRWLSR